jgi:hypothetical protein
VPAIASVAVPATMAFHLGISPSVTLRWMRVQRERTGVSS